jgi:hypothetical protein
MFHERCLTLRAAFYNGHTALFCDKCDHFSSHDEKEPVVPKSSLESTLQQLCASGDEQKKREAFVLVKRTLLTDNISVSDRIACLSSLVDNFAEPKLVCENNELKNWLHISINAFLKKNDDDTRTVALILKLLAKALKNNRIPTIAALYRRYLDNSWVALKNSKNLEISTAAKELRKVCEPKAMATPVIEAKELIPGTHVIQKHRKIASVLDKIDF